MRRARWTTLRNWWRTDSANDDQTMRHVHDGISASPGIVIGPAHVIQWDPPHVPHETIPEDAVEEEVEAFREALRFARDRILKLQARTAETLGSVEAYIFEPQLLMLEDSDLVDTTIRYVRENHISAARAFELRVLEFRSEWQRTGHPMLLDRLNDLLDIELRILRHLLGMDDPDFSLEGLGRKVILVARDLTPSLTVQLDRDVILGLATDAGSRTSHSAILARALELPAVVGLRDLTGAISTGDHIILDGRGGRVVVEPTQVEQNTYRERDIRIREWEQELLLLAHMDSVTPDRQPLLLRANIDLPGEAESARSHGAQGVGLFRTEFLVVGRSSFPAEEEQFQAYRRVAEVFPEDAVYIRTFDLGGDKYPRFLDMPPEENPFLGWRAIRVCLDMPDLFRTQLRAILRATAFGDVKIMLPLINEVDELARSRALLEEEEKKLRADGVPYNSGYKVGVMIETPAAVLTAGELARHADFFSIGTNDLIQYTLAVDRGNARLAPRFKTFHPAVLQLVAQTVSVGRAAGIEVSVCGEMAANPLGIFLLMGLGITAFSVSPSALPEIKKVVRAVPVGAARAAAAEALKTKNAEDAMMALTAAVSEHIDLSLFSGRWNSIPGG